MNIFPNTQTTGRSSEFPSVVFLSIFCNT